MGSTLPPAGPTKPAAGPSSLCPAASAQQAPGPPLQVPSCFQFPHAFPFFCKSLSLPKVALPSLPPLYPWPQLDPLPLLSSLGLGPPHLLVQLYPSSPPVWGIWVFQGHLPPPLLSLSPVNLIFSSNKAHTLASSLMLSPVSYLVPLTCKTAF